MQQNDRKLDTQAPFQLPAILDLGPKLITTLAAGSLMASVALQLGYLTVIDVRLAALFSFQDALIGAISTLPILVAAIPLIWLMSITLLKWIPGLRKWLDSNRFADLIVTLAFFALVFISITFVSVLLALALMFAGAILYTVRKKDLATLTPSLARAIRAASYCTIVLIAFYFSGAYLANANLRNPERPYKLTLSNGGIKDVSLLLLGQNTVIVLESGSLVYVLPRDEMRKLERLVPRYEQDAIFSRFDVWSLIWAYFAGHLESCRWTEEGFLCRGDKPDETLPSEN